MTKKLAAVAGLLIAFISIGTFVWSVFTYADSISDKVEDHSNSIRTLEINLLSTESRLGDVETTARGVDAASDSVRLLQRQIQYNAVANNIALQQINLDSIKRQKRNLMSKDQYSTLEQWEHAELLKLVDDEKDLEESIREQKRKLEQDSVNISM